ncbi:MAG: DUF4276 family protein [Desulfobacteraceae bacterium]|nr:DUF4276 family protein [Desulfobacteraceae bacterium]
MNRVLVLVEGQTEKKFIKEVMSPSLAARNIFLTARLTGKPGHKGGIREYQSIRYAELIDQLRLEQIST